MKFLMRKLICGFIAFIAMASAVHAAEPCVTSDLNENTACGTNALGTSEAGSGNSAFGYGALSLNTNGYANVATGTFALAGNTTGFDNTADGNYALYSNSTGNTNTAIGSGALFGNSTGYHNTATGASALTDNSTGYNNVATGAGALQRNTTGYNNVATGPDALLANTVGYNNTAIGNEALFSNTTGFYNTASGYEALYSNTTGSKNFADGVNALFFNTTGTNNTAFGVNALGSNTTGSYNIGEGFHGGYDLTTGSYNIAIGNTGVAAESGVIRIGQSPNQTTAYIAGISTTKLTGAAVYITASGQLGVLASSERYKTAIASLGDATANLQRLRPVSFRLKSDPTGAVQYGLIAEEVEKIYPELVLRDAQGQIQGVRYDELAPMLLNVVQQQQQTMAAQGARMTEIQQQVDDLKKLNESMQAAVSELLARNERVAAR